MNVQQYRGLMLQACTVLFTKQRPSFSYAVDASNLLFMTAAHESDGFKARRQYSFVGATGARRWQGAFSLFQVEWGSIQSSLQFLDKNPQLKERANWWLSQVQGSINEKRKEVILPLLETTDGDYLSIVLARIHYLRVPASIPGTLEGMAEYAKRYYNTPKGKATPAQYIRAYRSHQSSVKEI